MPGSMVDDTIVKDLLKGFIYPVTPITMIGRDDDAHIRVDSKHVSRRHAKIVLGTEGYFLEDMSRNGTFVNGDFLSKDKRLLREGDVIEIRRHADSPNQKPVFKGRLERVEAKAKNGLFGGILSLFGR